jgi:hypothetical protein
MFKSKFAFLLLIIASQVLSYDQDRDGVYVGFRLENLEHQNPYVSFSGPYYAPENITGYSDHTRSLYLPFGYAGYGRAGFSDFHTAALDLLIQGVLPLNGTDRPSYGKPQTSTGSIPLFKDYEDNIGVQPTSG